MHVSLQEGLYDLCRIRIANDEAFRSAASHRNFNVVDDALFDEYRLFQLKKTLRLVYEKSPFYKKLYAAHHVTPDDVQTIEDLSALPFTVPADLSGNSYGFLCTSQGDVEKPVTFHSSGATGMKKRIFFSRADIKKILDFLPRGMNTVIGREEGIVQIFLQNSQGRGIGQMLASSLENFGMKAFLSDLTDPAEKIIQTTVGNHVNVWFGEAITILRTTRLLERQMDLSKIGMKCLFLTMTNIPDSMVEYLEKTWNCRVSTHYGLTEMGWGLAVDCDVCDGYHYNELDVIAEVVDPRTGRVLPDGSEGELAFTSIARDCMPLVRYRSGDISSLKPGKCGHLQVMRHIMRRKEGAYDLGGGNEIYPAMFDEALFRVAELVDYRISAKGDQLYIEAEVTDRDPAVAEKIADSLMTLDALRGGKRPAVLLLPEGALREYCFEKKRIIEKT